MNLFRLFKNKNRSELDIANVQTEEIIIKTPLSPNTELEGLDTYFVAAGLMITQKTRASIGMIQRRFNLGFNRAESIMNELEENGVVDAENGTSPRNVLMTQEEFEFFVRNYTPKEKEAINQRNTICERIGLYDNKYDYMEGHDFEYFCSELLQKNGFVDVVVTQGSGDQGIDVIATRDGVKYGIQCKCYSSDISNKAVQEAYSGARFYDCHVPVVLTNRHFTKSAKELAKKNGVLLWDREKLEEMIHK